MRRLFGATKVIWLPGLRSPGDCTDGHVDGFARFTEVEGMVLVHREDCKELRDEHRITRRHIDILRRSRDALGNPLSVVALPGPTTSRKAPKGGKLEEACFSYANFYVANGAVFCPEFGDKKADKRAFEIIQKAFPSRKVVQLNIDGIAYGGGGIHCVTQQEPE
uniref:Agmatine deiminase n=1 Tax=Lotharella globosa TaxID=91324 RepID=A0A7S4DM37_9EUKA|mmetsp:Transcript_30020/g.57817  ORF Transcript_30020/g.57817 Transcript_30020/m.57817 type:complete len:164 (+) Transcript_30020:1-492(+)